MGLVTLEKLEEKVCREDAAARDAAKATWRELATAVADGQKIDEQATLATLEALGKSASDLRDAADELTERRELASRAGRATSIRSELEEIRAKQLELSAAYDTFVRANHAEQYELNNRQLALQSQLFDAEGAERKLRNSVTDPDLLARRSALTQQLTELGKRVHWCEKPFGRDVVPGPWLQYTKGRNLYAIRVDLRRAETELAELPDDAFGSTRSRYEQAILSLKAELGRAEAQKAGWERQIQAIEEQIAALDADLLTP